MDPVLLFGLVALAGATILFTIFRDEGDFAEDDPDDAGGGAGSPDTVTTQDRQTTGGAKDAPSDVTGTVGDIGSTPEGR
ncbi:hypothetical protein [Antarcticimicrobium sediminis]|uniref:Uncharacterized protein n=1 Tax=Antarcticimicrobium sediminis TaxID=2546227 RepID=A0A4R5ESI3_9RHOB|nr:hypothetical protein [Antarcticimicrobium sediminis]TDE37825.1 hypothetical protein E1B25_10370 [Antarcticimicrobium sediminis]